jgi:hypothetical protein
MQRVHKPVPCKIEYVGLENDLVGCIAPSVIATCSRCCHQTESIGTSLQSLRECLSSMREECPCGGFNEYGVDVMASPRDEAEARPPLDQFLGSQPSYHW